MKVERRELEPGELFFPPGPGIITYHRPEPRDPTPPAPSSDDDSDEDQDIASVVEHRS